MIKDKSKLVKKIITNKAGKKQGVWVKLNPEDKKVKVKTHDGKTVTIDRDYGKNLVFSWAFGL